MVPDLSYAGMAIADGMAAMQTYHDMCAMEAGETLAQLRKAMLEYCRLDTLAIVRILENLEKIGLLKLNKSPRNCHSGLNR